MKTVARIMLFSACITSTLIGMKKDNNELHTFCTQHVAFHSAQLEKKYAKISVTNLTGSFIKKYIAVQKALEELQNHKEEIKTETNIKKRTLSDSQKRTVARNKIMEEKFEQKKINYTPLSLSESSDSSDLDSLSLSSISDSEDEIIRKVETGKLI